MGRPRLTAGRDIASAVSRLASAKNHFVTGTVIDVDGGFTLGLADAEGS